MAAFIDLHCHWVPGIDDGVSTAGEALELLRALRRLGFGRVIATPHMRPGMFNNTRHDIEQAYAAIAPALDSPELPHVGLGCEHFFDDVVFERIMAGQALPYPGGKAVLVEFASDQLPVRVDDRLYDLRRRGLRPVIAHPERYRIAWKDPARMRDWVDRGMVLLLDVAALTGKYGRAPRKSAEMMLQEGLYYAACSDAHRPSDAVAVGEAIERLRKIVGDDETHFLLAEGPAAVLQGTVEL